MTPLLAKIDWWLLMDQIGWMDIVLVLVCAVGVVVGLKKGLTKILPNLMAVAIAETYLVAFHTQVSAQLQRIAPLSPTVFDIAAFVIIAGAVIFLVRLFFFILAYILRYEFKSAINNIAGGLAGGLLFALVFGLLVSFLMMIPSYTLRGWMEMKSVSSEKILKINDRVYDVMKWSVPPGFKDESDAKDA